VVLVADDGADTRAVEGRLSRAIEKKRLSVYDFQRGETLTRTPGYVNRIVLGGLVNDAAGSIG